jgi:glycosyltransferase involved in cell wall biosynthesis
MFPEDEIMRIFVASNYGYWGNWTPDDLNGEDIQIGGGESAMVNISKELAALGHEVFVFYDTKPGKYEGVDYLPTAYFTPLICSMEHDVLVTWDAVHLMRFNDLAKLHVCAFQLNDAQIGVYDWAVDLYFHPSQWHLDRFQDMYPEMTKEKSLPRMTNGIDYGRYVSSPPVNPNKVIYSSSPDRGLHHLLRLWPKVMDEQPEAELHVFYDISKWLEIDEQLGDRNATHDRAVMIREFVNNPPDNVTFHGGVGKARLSLEQSTSRVLAYPCDPISPTEGFSMTVLEGIAAGCDVVVSDADALPELWSNAPGVTMMQLPIDDDLWAETIVQKLGSENGEGRDVRIRQDLSWSAVARKWVREIESCLKLITS